MQSRYYNAGLCRFNAPDAFVSTGQGMLGNNMYAYCNNNPANCYDPAGNAAFYTTNGDRNPLFIGYLGMGGGAGGGYSRGNVGGGQLSSRQQARAIVRREINYLTNTDEQVVIDANYVAFYNGVLVIKSNNPWGSFSLGFILLNSNESDDVSYKTLKHEYGHYLHMRDIGIVKYSTKIVIPSLAFATLSQFDLLQIFYYDLPWERIAEEYGDVNRGGYAVWSKVTASLYWLYSWY